MRALKPTEVVNVPAARPAPAAPRKLIRVPGPLKNPTGPLFPVDPRLLDMLQDTSVPVTRGAAKKPRRVR